MALKLVRFRYPSGGGTVWALTIPQPNTWIHGRRVLGGQHESASGIVETYVIARRRPLDLTIRVKESELASLDAFLDWWENNGAAFDVDLGDGTFVPSYLDSPKVGDPLQYQPVEGYTMAVECALTIRRTDGTAYTTTFF